LGTHTLDLRLLADARFDPLALFICLASPCRFCPLPGFLGHLSPQLFGIRKVRQIGAEPSHEWLRVRDVVVLTIQPDHVLTEPGVTRNLDLFAGLDDPATEEAAGKKANLHQL
jgi:hypothetical protein